MRLQKLTSLLKEDSVSLPLIHIHTHARTHTFACISQPPTQPNNILTHTHVYDSFSNMFKRWFNPKKVFSLQRGKKHYGQLRNYPTYKRT